MKTGAVAWPSQGPKIERLEAKLRASEGREGMAERVKAINARLEELHQ